MKLFYRVSICCYISALTTQSFIAAPSVQPTLLKNQIPAVSTPQKVVTTAQSTASQIPLTKPSPAQVPPIQAPVIDKTYTEWKNACHSYTQEIADTQKELSDLFKKLCTQKLSSVNFDFEKTKSLSGSHVILKESLTQALTQQLVAQEKTFLAACPRTITTYPLSKKEWMQARDNFVQACTQHLTKASWVEGVKNPSVQIAQGLFKPYVQKLVVQSGETLTIIGDLHSDVDALINTLEVLKARNVLDDAFKLKKSHYLVFLGDYTDRGACGVEILYGIFRLKTANPEQVIVLRGNHEDSSVNEASPNFLGKELALKLGLTTVAERAKNVYKLYNLMPVALYVCTPNNDSIVLTHGGLDCGFDPSPLLKAPSSKEFMGLGTLHRKTAIKKLNGAKNTLQITVSPQRLLDNVVPTTPSDLHFLWNDFGENLETTNNTLHNVGWEYGELLTQSLLKRDGVKTIIRGHNHLLSLEGNGLYSLYNGLVTTVTSFRSHGASKFFSEYSFITLSLHTRYANWQATYERDGKSSSLKLGDASTHIPVLTKKKAALLKNSSADRQALLQEHAKGLV